VIVEANHERGNHVEFLAEVRKRVEGINSLNDPVNTEQPRKVPKHRQTIHIEANSGMTEQLRDVEEVSRAAAQVENLLWTREIELELTNPPDVDADPAIEIEIFRPVRTGIAHGVLLANLVEPDWIDRLDNALCLQRKAIRAQRAEGVFSRARKTFTID